MKKPTYRRIFAYVIDIIIINIIVLAFTNIKFLNPKMDEYQEAANKYEEYIAELSMTDPTSVLTDEKATDLSYEVAYYGVPSTLITLIITFLYFSLFQYYTKGKTLGKLICGLEVVSTDKKELKLSQVIIRSAIIDSIFTSSILLIMVLFLTKASFIKLSIFVQILDAALLFTSFGMIIYRNDGVGLHDYLAKTRVILSCEKEDFLEDNNEIKDAKIVKEKTSVINEKTEKIKITRKKTTKKGDK